MFQERSESLCLELHRPLGDMRFAFLQVNSYGFVKRLAREFAPRFRSILALFDFGNAILLELFRLPLIGCVQRLAITNAVDRYIEMPVTNAFVNHAAPFSAGFPRLDDQLAARLAMTATAPPVGSADTHESRSSGR
jgi:hypothetical protein